MAQFQEENNWFFYYRNITNLDSMHRWIAYTNTKFNPHLYKDKTLIDMGCGWGLFSLLCSLQGAKQVIAIGPDSRVDFLEALLNKHGLSRRVIVRKTYFDMAIELTHHLLLVQCCANSQRLKSWPSQNLRYRFSLNHQRNLQHIDKVMFSGSMAYGIMVS